MTAIVLGVVVLGETLQAGHLARMALIGVGLLAVDGRFRRAIARIPATGSRCTAP